MKISTVLLRWHKSFNVNYNGYDDRKKSITSRPWNNLYVKDGAKEDFLFIEIPIEHDVTTIVGANESGKSHLLDAICKVLLGYGNDDRFLDKPNEEKKFAVTDLCHFASVRTKNAEVYPNIGLGFDCVTDQEADALATFLEAGAGVRDAIISEGLTLILAPREGEADYAYVFISSTKIPLTEARLIALREAEILPKVEFIRSNLAIADEISLDDLMASYEGKAPSSSYEPVKILEIAKALSQLDSLPDGQPTTEWVEEVKKLQNQVRSAQIEAGSKGHLEAMLFDKIMGISLEALQKVAALRLTDRPFAEGQIALWNVVLRDELNLSRYWQQDPFFALQLNLKRGILYFEIKDKTGSTYTFAERSSGLRYFLSYYIQAKALEVEKSNRQIVILMDEPDSFLSTQGQRNLLAVFESLVSASSSQGNAQLIYTTHSPWLINRNFPGRLRLMRKGEAEEGTQYIHSPVVRRYEPVRSALGVDCAQTLFMGATNLVLEGPTEQLLLCELMRAFATPTTLYEFLDLNSLVTVSAESAANIPQVLAHSSWSDEVKPATIVLVDNDDEGRLAVEKCCENHFAVNDKGETILIKAGLPKAFALTVADLLGESFGEAEKLQKVKSIEDLVPTSLYVQAVRRYLLKWQATKFESQKIPIEAALQKPNLAKDGIVEGIKQCIIAADFHTKGKFDKMGVAEEVLSLVTKPGEATYADLASDVQELESRVKRCCRKLQESIDEAERQQKTATGTDSIRLSLRQFMAGRKSATVSELIRAFRRLVSEVELLGDDGATLREIVNKALEELAALEHAGQPRIEDDFWNKWTVFINSIQKNPLDPQTSLPRFDPPTPLADALPEAPSPQQGVKPAKNTAKAAN